MEKETKKTATFVVMFCLLMVGAVAAVCESVPSPVVNKPEPMNVNGMKGDISLMNSPIATIEPITLSESASESRDAACAAARNYMWENVLNQNEYHVNYQTCKVEQKVRYYDSHPCGRKVMWSNQVYGWVKGEPIYRFDEPQYRSTCSEQHTKWVEVN